MIRKRRESLGFSQARLGELVGRSASTIRNWERGKSTPGTPGDAVALAAILGLDETDVVEAAGFEMKDVDGHPTVEQAYASLAPSLTPTDDATDVEPGEEVESAEPADPPDEVPSEPGLTTVTDEETDGPVEDEPSTLAPEDSAPEPTSIPPPPRSVSWEKPSREPFAGRHAAHGRPTEDEAEAEDERVVARAAPPTVLEMAPTAEPSYVEDPAERQRYKARALATAAVVVFMLIVFLWSFDRAVDALGTMWDDFIGMLEL